jgi:ABC-type branched-subunit amino acid transport system ATPase component/branched-subunit amino acid ABC-type transport system permease component
VRAPPDERGTRTLHSPISRAEQFQHTLNPKDHWYAMLPFIISGIVAGSVYGMIGVGLVLTFKTSGIFNFGYGALGTLAAYLFYFLSVEHDVPLIISLIVSIGLFGLILGFGLERLAHGLASRPLAAKITATIGILLVVQAGTSLYWGAGSITVDQWLPSGGFSIDGTRVSWAQLITFLIALIATGALYTALHFTRIGKSMRAVVDNPELLALAGTSPVLVRRIAWTVSSAFVALSAILLAPTIGLDPFVLTALVLQGFGAAAFGGFRNILLTFAGGIVIGIVSSSLTKWITEPGILNGLAPSVPFIVLFAVTVLLPKRYLVSEGISVARSLVTPWKPPITVVTGTAIVAFILLALVPQFVGFRIVGWSTALCYVLLLLSLGLLVRVSGQVSLAHIAFAAIGVVAFSKLTDEAGIPWVPAMVAAGLIAVPIGAMLAIPAIRLSGLYLAVATFGFGYLMQNMFYNTDLMFGTDGVGVPVSQPDVSWLTDDPDHGVYYVILAIVALTVATLLILTRTRLGRILSAMSDSPVGLEANGAGVTVSRVLVFCVSAFLAGIAGALLGVVQVQASVQSYNPLLSITLLALVMIVVGGIPWYAYIGAAGFALVPVYLTEPHTATWLELFFGVSAMVVAVFGLPHLSPTVRALIDRAKLPQRTRELSDAAATAPRAAKEGGLEINDLTVRFGGLVAVNGLSLKAPTGRITGLMGPNGAGKSTTFAAASGLVKPSEGDIVLDGNNVGGTSVGRRARLGLGRSFQQMELFESLTVRENVAMGREAGFAGRNPLRQMVNTRKQRSEIRARTDEALTLCGITELADHVVSNLSTGQRRLVELARCLAGDFHILMLDEPSSGLDRTETEALGGVLARVVAERGVGILLVEHDMSLVMGVCDYLYVLDFGALIFEGTTVEARASELVRSAYLGAEDQDHSLNELEKSRG